MKPNELSRELKRIAFAIENSKNPSRELVARDLSGLVLKVAGNQTLKDLFREFEGFVGMLSSFDLKYDTFPDIDLKVDNNFGGFITGPSDLETIKDYAKYVAAVRSAAFHNATRPIDTGFFRAYKEVKNKYLGKLPGNAPKSPLGERVQDYKTQNKIKAIEAEMEALWQKMQNSGDFRRYPEHEAMENKVRALRGLPPLPKNELPMVNPGDLDDWEF